MYIYFGGDTSMSAGKSMEDVLRDIHLLISKCPKIKGDPDRVVINKQELFAELEKISHIT